MVTAAKNHLLAPLARQESINSNRLHPEKKKSRMNEYKKNNSSNSSSSDTIIITKIPLKPSQIPPILPFLHFIPPLFIPLGSLSYSLACAVVGAALLLNPARKLFRFPKR